MFKRIVSLMLSICLFSVSLQGRQVPQQNQKGTPPTVAAKPSTLAQGIRKSVGFLTVTYLKDGRIQQISGTCFFTFYEDKRLGENRGFPYLVTNRHMAVPGVEVGHNYPVQKVTVRLNLRNAAQSVAATEETIPLGGDLHWTLPADEAVDLAVLAGRPDVEKYDFAEVPVSLFVSKQEIEEQRIDAGDNVAFGGFFYQFPGQRKIQPIIREGMLAMMPDEEVETTLHKPGHLYLADVHAFHGNSGSPLFVNLGGMRNGSLYLGSSYHLLGIISGYYLEDADFKLTVATTVEGTLHANSGIALAVPAYELKALLDSPTLQEARDAVVRAAQAKK
jgi:hypothetical protein